MRTYTTTVRYGRALNFHVIEMSWGSFPLAYLAIIRGDVNIESINLRCAPSA